MTLCARHLCAARCLCVHARGRRSPRPCAPHAQTHTHTHSGPRSSPGARHRIAPSTLSYSTLLVFFLVQKCGAANARRQPCLVNVREHAGCWCRGVSGLFCPRSGPGRSQPAALLVSCHLVNMISGQDPSLRRSLSLSFLFFFPPTPAPPCSSAPGLRVCACVVGRVPPPLRLRARVCAPQRAREALGSAHRATR